MTLSPDAAEIIRRKKTEYCRFADTNQFHLFDRIALPDATFRFAGPDGTILNEKGIVYSWENRQTFCDAFTEALANVQCIHSVGPGQLEQTSPDEVKAVFTVVYHVGPKGTDTKNHGTGGGHYHETWKRQGDDWFLADLWMQRIYWIVRD